MRGLQGEHKLVDEVELLVYGGHTASNVNREKDLAPSCSETLSHTWESNLRIWLKALVQMIVVVMT